MIFKTEETIENFFQFSSSSAWNKNGNKTCETTAGKRARGGKIISQHLVTFFICGVHGMSRCDAFWR